MTNIEALYTIYQQHPSVQTDTRLLKRGDLFFALKGPHFNGNMLAKKALELGAAYAIIDDSDYQLEQGTILTDDVLTTLQALALHHRKQFLQADGITSTIPFIAITGSNGKTTTKELIHAVLSTHFKTYTTTGNLNNHIGIPLTLLKIGMDAAIAVVEMGANHLGEIQDYCTYTLPTHGLITNCGKAHLEGFGNEEGVRKAKGELFDYLRAHHGTAFMMRDYPYLHTMSKGITDIVTYGTMPTTESTTSVTGLTNTSKDTGLTGQTLQNSALLKVRVELDNNSYTVQTRLAGDYNFPNILAAFAVGYHFGVPVEKIVTALENYHPNNSRSQQLQRGNNLVLLDAYNANPSSMQAAIKSFAEQGYSNNVLLLGAMMELGTASIAEHQDLVDQIQRYKWNMVVLVGGDFKTTSHPYHYFDNVADAEQFIAAQNIQHSNVLIKGSRSIGMEKMMDALPS